MNQLKIINQNGQLLVDSRDVAEMTEKQHGHLLRDIEGYIKILAESNFGVSDFFIQNTYQDSTGRTLPCFLLTKKGCDMVANKMTGEKGVLFTATYVTKFEEMHQQLQKQLHSMTHMEMIAHIAQQAAEKEKEDARRDQAIKSLETGLHTIKETIIQRDEDWRKSINTMFNSAVIHSDNKDYRALRNESYALLEERARCNLNQRLRNLLDRLEQSGATKTQINNTSKMGVIENDPRLKEIYTAIVKEISIRYVPVGVS